jgi:hypothetical protein
VDFLEEQLIVRRGGSDDDVASFFSLRPEVTVEHTVRLTQGGEFRVPLQNKTFQWESGRAS